MPERNKFPEGRFRRALEIIRDVDPDRVLEMTRDGTLRVLPAKATSARSDVDEWFEGNSGDAG